VLCRHPNPHLDPTNQGNACLWFSFCETGWSMLWRTVKWLLFWCRDMFWLMGRLGQIKLTHLVSWVRVILSLPLQVLWFFHVHLLDGSGIFFFQCFGIGSRWVSRSFYHYYLWMKVMDELAIILIFHLLLGMVWLRNSKIGGGKWSYVWYRL